MAVLYAISGRYKWILFYQLLKYVLTLTQVDGKTIWICSNRLVDLNLEDIHRHYEIVRKFNLILPALLSIIFNWY